MDPECTIKMNHSVISEHVNAPINNVRKFAYPLLTHSISNDDLIQREIKHYRINEIQDLQPDINDLRDEVKKVEISPRESEEEETDYYHTVEIGLIIVFYGSLLTCLCVINLYFRYKQNIQEQWNRAKESMFASSVNL